MYSVHVEIWKDTYFLAGFVARACSMNLCGIYKSIICAYAGGPYLQSKQVHTISVRCHWLRFHVLHMAHKPT